MKYELTFEENLNRFTLTTFNALTLPGIQEMLKALVTHESWRKGRDLVVDHRQASFSKISPEEMRFLADAVVALDQHLGARYCAVISPDDGISKHAMYQFDVEPRADLVTRVFLSHEYSDALKWLNERSSNGAVATKAVDIGS